MGHEKGAFLKLETNCSQISIMTRGNEMLEFDIVRAPWNIGAPGYHARPLRVSLSLFHSAPLIFNLCSRFSHHASHRQRGSSDSRSSDELPTQGGYRGLHPSTSGSEEGVQDLCEVGVHPRLSTPSMEQLSGAHCTGTRVHMVVVQHKNITILNDLLLTMNSLSYLNNRPMLFFFLCYL